MVSNSKEVPCYKRSRQRIPMFGMLLEKKVDEYWVMVLTGIGTSFKPTSPHKSFSSSLLSESVKIKVRVMLFVRVQLQMCTGDLNASIPRLWSGYESLKEAGATRKMEYFFRVGPTDWLLANLRGDFSLNKGMEDGVLFATLAWWSWKDQNAHIFRPDKKQPISVEFILVQGRMQEKAMITKATRENMRNKSTIDISWLKPSLGWFTINTNGAVRGELGLASAGGCIRDQLGTWLGGFVVNIGSCSVITAELKAISAWTLLSSEFGSPSDRA
ncbi:hypothetical protein V2J09_022133 [Rumex salicifolius]